MLLRTTLASLYMRVRAQSTLDGPPIVPWFMQREHDRPQIIAEEIQPELPPLPSDIPSHLHILYNHLATLPLLDRSSILVSRPLPPRPSPPIQFRKPQGRRRRGGHLDAGEGVGEPPSPWNWIVLAEVKQGTEGKGAIDVIMRSARQVLVSTHPHLALPPKKSIGRNTQDGWGFLDAGDTAIHILSKDAREKWFSDSVDYY